MTYYVKADIRYRDGPLFGRVIPAGYRVTCAGMNRAQEISRWLLCGQRESTAICDTETGDMYFVIGNVEYGKCA